MAKKHRENKQSEQSERPQEETENQLIPSGQRDDQNGEGNQPSVPVTGEDYTVVVVPSDTEVDMSDLLDLSDLEDMEQFAARVEQDLIPDMVDSEATEMSKYADDQDILEDLSDRQELPGGTERLLDTLREHTGESPELSADDIDADWEGDHASGEESVGGSVATPEQNVVDELGEAVGVEYNDFEPLDTEDKIDARDKNRWELNPESADPDETMIDYDKFKDVEQGRNDDVSDYQKLDKDYRELMDDDPDNEFDQDDSV